MIFIGLILQHTTISLISLLQILKTLVNTVIYECENYSKCNYLNQNDLYFYFSIKDIIHWNKRLEFKAYQI